MKKPRKIYDLSELPTITTSDQAPTYGTPSITGTTEELQTQHATATTLYTTQPADATNKQKEEP